MTAEVAVMNKNAIALAADSAVTISLPDESQLRAKVRSAYWRITTRSGQDNRIALDLFRQYY